jgi:hypothetical protein
LLVYAGGRTLVTLELPPLGSSRRVAQHSLPVAPKIVLQLAARDIGQLTDVDL